MNGPKSVFLLLLVAAGCHGDLTASNGELGRLQYRLATDWESGQDELTALPLMTRLEHRILVELTARGTEEAGEDAWQIHHRAAVGQVSTDPGDAREGDAPDFGLRADEAGAIEIVSELDGRVFDRITLQLADPTRLDVRTWVRAPWEDAWQDHVGETISVARGSQISFLAIPMTDTSRVAGEFTPTITVDAPERVVPDAQVAAVQEGGVTVIGEPVTYFAVEAGPVTFTLAEPEHDVTTTRTLDIVE